MPSIDDPREEMTEFTSALPSFLEGLWVIAIMVRRQCEVAQVNMVCGASERWLDDDNRKSLHLMHFLTRFESHRYGLGRCWLPLCSVVCAGSFHGGSRRYGH